MKVSCRLPRGNMEFVHGKPSITILKQHIKCKMKKKMLIQKKITLQRRGKQS